MRTPTPEQRAVLDCSARVCVVRATPGSGKTWLVAELIRQELDRWSTSISGIAALSFTRVGGEEIRKAVGYELDQPHFVGTIDAFLFRYVVRPFFRSCFPRFADPRLVPGEWGTEYWNNYGLIHSTTVGQDINLFGCVFIDEEQSQVVVAHKPYPALPLQRLVGVNLEKVKAAKMRLWKESGCLTHSDAAYWATRILEHPVLGGIVRAEIVRRFPYLIVDELQDTGYFLGKSIRLLLSEPIIHGVLVGDPDQAIFEFTGARPDLFDEFGTLEGAVCMSLASSRRCPRFVINVAKHLKDSGGEIGPAEDREGQAILVSYSDMKADIDRIMIAITNPRRHDNIKVIARSNQTINRLIGRGSAGEQKIGCPALYHIHRAVIGFRQGRQVAALAAARAALDVAVFKHEGVSDKQLNQSKIDPQDWKSLSIRCLLCANALTTTGNLFDWQKAAGEIIDAEIGAFGLDPSLNYSAGKLKPQKRGEWEKPSADYLPQPGGTSLSFMGVPVQTVHGVKGETHDVTIFVCPPVNRADRCPSIVWWSANDKDREEKRIAYVAMTRTQGVLIVCVSEDCFQRLTNRQPQFVASFECMTVDEYVAVLGECADTI
jgi:DNA helicase-2/ATP-dependent DNA helicase PcrA